jgi:hypothetical protein
MITKFLPVLSGRTKLLDVPHVTGQMISFLFHPLMDRNYDF